MLNKIQLCARALLLIGCDPITSFADGTAEADVAALLYEPSRDALLSSHPWSFATGLIELSPVTSVPLADFSAAYQLPEDFLRVLSLGAASRGTGRGMTYRIRERRICCDETGGVILTYVFRPAETTFPPFFDQALIARLSADFCLPLTENSERTRMQFDLAEAAWKRAKTIDAQQQTPQVVEDFGLIEVRR